MSLGVPIISGPVTPNFRSEQNLPYPFPFPFFHPHRLTQASSAHERYSRSSEHRTTAIQKLAYGKLNICNLLVSISNDPIIQPADPKRGSRPTGLETPCQTSKHPRSAHLRRQVQHAREHLHVFVRDVLPRHGHHAGLRLCLHLPLVLEACPERQQGPLSTHTHTDRHTHAHSSDTASAATALM